MERKEAIRSAYRLTGSSFYDGMMTCSTLPGRLVCRLVWDMDKQMCSEYQEKALSGIPEDFSGRLLLRVGRVPADRPAHPARI
jgi:methylase involved in ubiquinone/menaquinone biosynthesis